jgi:hypothetical protein
MPKYSEEIVGQVRKLWSVGDTQAEISQHLGLPKSTVQEWCASFAKESTMKASQDGARDMELAALRQQIKDLESRLSPPERASVTSAWKGDPADDIRQKWLTAEEDNDSRIEKARTQSKFTADLPPDKPVAIAFISDQHISTGNVIDLKRMRADAELIANTDGVYAVLGGDGVDNHIKHRAAVLAARSQPDDQWRMFSWYLGIMAKRILVVISGNHDAWTNQIGGVDMVHLLADQHKLHYAPDEARVNVMLGPQEYRLAVRHQYRFNSSLNLCHTVKQWWRMGEEPFDIGTICHHHEAAIESFEAHDKECWACRPGAYQITSGHSRQYGFNMTKPTCPTFVVYPDRREIVGFRDLRPALRLLEAERKCA